ncbi:MAG: OprD family porin [Sulfurospirillum sp.]|nr:OprD family porin [Sulfurospirillum sp.]
MVKPLQKIGRQYISTPLVSGSGSRFFKESFEGVTVVNTDIPQTTLVAGYVNKFQGRTSAISGNGNGDAPTFEKSAVFNGAAGVADFDGAYTAAIINKSITGLTLTAQYGVFKDVDDAADVDVYYTEANYVLPVANFKLGFDVNYRGSRTDTGLDADNNEGDMFGARVSIKDLAGFGASFAATTTDSNDNVILGMGNGTSTYTGTLIQGSAGSTATADTDAYKFQVNYDFSKVGVAGLSAMAQYQWTDQGHSINKTTGAKDIDTDYTSIGAGVYYKVAALPGLTTGLEYETREADKGTTKYDTDELWFKAGYKF